MWDRPPLFGGREPLLDLLTHVEVVLDVLERCVVGQVLEELAYFVLGCFQLALPNCTLLRLKATAQSVCPLGAARAGRLVVSALRITLALSGRSEQRELRTAEAACSTNFATDNPIPRPTTYWIT